ncbi:MAG: tripartite tricarboxylate transporter permease [Candidatus Hadarchaeum sp.]|uniref:tripartite tricarboxylate transporter permease n=1 Tax=Candidatus Hadarchaeum sp. TaxID=2883567 RepID=UPI00316E30C1
MLETLAYVMAGVALGTLTGLILGLHVNNLTPILIALAAGASREMVALIVAMSITNAFISYIPSTFLAAPEEGTELSVLPAHRLLLEGRGYQAIRLSATGCLGGVMLSAALALPFMPALGPIYDLIKPLMHWLLLAVTGVMISLERSWNKIVWALAIFLVSGLLGLVSLDSGIMPADTALLPLLSGLFGASVLLPSIINCSSLPEQYTDEKAIKIQTGLKPVCAGTAAGILTGIVPSIGPSQGTVLAQLVARSRGTEEFLLSVSSVNTSKAIFSFLAIFAIGRARSGAAVAVQKIMEAGNVNPLLIIGVALLAGGIAAILELQLGKLAAGHMDRLPYRGLGVAVMTFILGLTFYCSGLIGILVLVTATAVGTLPALTKVKRTHCMGVLMLPCMLFFAGAKNIALTALGL